MIFRICSLHFAPEDFERDLRNEMLGLPLRKLLKPGAAPRHLEHDPIGDGNVIDISEDNEVGQVEEEDDEELEIFAEKIDFETPSRIKPVSEMHKKMVDQISREVDILAEIAELQMKLVKKIGSKKGDLDSLANVLSDPNNSFQVSKDTVVRSIKDEIYKKKDNSRMANSPGENDIHVILNQDTKESTTIKDFKAELKAKCGLKNTDDPLVIFDLNSHHEFQKRVRKIRTELEDLEQMAPELKKNNKVRVKRVREKMIEEGEKNVEKKQAEIETYKLKVVELRLWKKKWQGKCRNNELKKRKRKEKNDKRRAWIKEQIEKGYMHKSCTILIHSRAKFPNEPGFEPIKKPRGINKKFASADNLCPLIKGVHIGKNGMVYPFKKRVENMQNSPPTKPSKAPKRPKQPESEPEPIPESILPDAPILPTVPSNLGPIVEPIFTLINPQDSELILQHQNVPGNQEIHYLQEPIMAENIVLDENGGAVIHLVQFDPNQSIL